MVGAVVYGSMKSKHREASQNTGLCRFLNTLADCGNVFLGNCTAHNLRIELEQLFSVGVHRLETYLTVSILSASAGLLRILAVHIHGLRKGLFVGNLRRTYICLYLVLAEKTVNNNLKMQLAHTGDNGLPRLRVCVSTEGRVLLGQLRESLAHLALTGLCLRLDSQLDNRLRELHRLQNYRMLLVADGITCGRKLKAYCRGNVSGIYLVKLRSLICVHLKDTSYTLLLLFGRIIYVGTGIHGSGVYTEECKLSYEGVCHNLKCQCGERLFVRRMTLRLISVHIRSLDRRNVGGSGHIVKHRIQKLLNALVPVSRAAAYGNCRTLAGSLSQSLLQIFRRGFFSLQVHHHQIIVQLADFFNQLGTIKLGIVRHISRDINNGNVLALLIVVDVGFHLEQINDSLKFIFLSNGKLNADGILTKSCFNHFYRIVEISTQDVHLVDERHTGYIVGVSLTPNIFRLRLYTALRTEHAYGAVQYTKGTLYLNRKVNVTRGINDIDTMLQSSLLGLAVFLMGPMTGCSCGSDGDTTLLFLLHPVHSSSTFVSISNFIVYASVIQNTLGQCGLTGIDMSHNSDISGSLQWIFSSSHGFSSSNHQAQTTFGLD